MKESTLITLAVVGGLAVAGYFIWQHYQTTSAAAAAPVAAQPTLGQQIGSAVDTAGSLYQQGSNLYDEASEYV
jgi:predicted negative regulator of RcsB-dependent stress response